MAGEREITILGRWKIVIRRREQPPREWVEFADAWRHFVAVVFAAALADVRRLRRWMRAESDNDPAP